MIKSYFGVRFRGVAKSHDEEIQYITLVRLTKR